MDIRLYTLLRRDVSNREIEYENSVVLQEALEPHYIHQIGGKWADDDVVTQSVIGNGNR